MEKNTFEILISELRDLYQASGEIEKEFLEDTLRYVISDFIAQLGADYNNR